MALKLVLFAAALVLCSGMSQALECISCQYAVLDGKAVESMFHNPNCKDEPTNTSVVTCRTNKEYKCSVSLSKQDDDNYSWSRSCRLDCSYRIYGHSWQSCCEGDRCNDFSTYRSEDDTEAGGKWGNCYSCSYRELNGVAWGQESCKTGVSMDTSIPTVDCSGSCIIWNQTYENLTSGTSGNLTRTSETSWVRGCVEFCPNIIDFGGYVNYVTCCKKNKCNAGDDGNASGADVNFRSGHFLSAITLAAMVICGFGVRN